jgi:hypothetical protein
MLHRKQHGQRAAVLVVRDIGDIVGAVAVEVAIDADLKRAAGRQLDVLCHRRRSEQQQRQKCGVAHRSPPSCGSGQATPGGRPGNRFLTRRYGR